MKESENTLCDMHPIFNRLHFDKTLKFSKSQYHADVINVNVTSVSCIYQQQSTKDFRTKMQPLDAQEVAHNVSEYAVQLCCLTPYEELSLKCNLVDHKN